MIINMTDTEERSTHRMVACTQVSCWAAHTKEYLIVDSPRMNDQWITDSADYLQLSALPRSLEKLPVERARGHVESAWVYENLTTCSQTRRLEIGIGDGSEVRKDLFVHQLRLIRGTSRHSIPPSRCEQTLSNQT